MISLSDYFIESGRLFQSNCHPPFPDCSLRLRHKISSSIMCFHCHDSTNLSYTTYHGTACPQTIRLALSSTPTSFLTRINHRSQLSYLRSKFQQRRVAPVPLSVHLLNECSILCAWQTLLCCPTSLKHGIETTTTVATDFCLLYRRLLELLRSQSTGYHFGSPLNTTTTATHPTH